MARLTWNFGAQALLAFALTEQAALGDVGVTESTCVTLAPNAEGQIASTKLQSLHVLEQTLGDAAFVLPADAPKGVESLMCARSSIVPAPQDYKVLLVGITLNIVNAGRVTVLEVSKGQLRLRVLTGTLTSDEAVAVKNRLSEMQLQFRAHEPNNSLERSRDR